MCNIGGGGGVSRIFMSSSLKINLSDDEES